jgi:4,5:9,10-diseco-3-hydroxy-5,9,17-trioxoandrosta-1(10),2-diene-4-oate hydrolase
VLQGIKRDSKIPSFHIEVKGLSIHYKSTGHGQPIIFIHGGANDWHEWKKNIPFFARHFSIYVPDLPGFGLSQKPDEPVSPHSLALFLKEFMDSLSINRAHIIAHSLGGMVAIATALEYPERINKLVMVDSAGIGELSQRGLFIISFIKAIKNIFKKNDDVKFKEGKHYWHFEDRLDQIKAPVLLVWGARDPYLPLSQGRTAHRLIPDSKLHVFPLCHHAPQRESTHKFNNLVHHFLLEE